MSEKTRIRFVLSSVMVVSVALVSAFPAPVQALLNCKGVSCAQPFCEEGQHTEVPPGQCCPVCVPD